MRLDKFLKVSRIIKRRTVAKNFAENERVEVNSRLAKPSTQVKEGDIITIIIGDKKTLYEILDLKEHMKASETQNMYKILDSK